jgi:TorA maturation chaperone TorD
MSNQEPAVEERVVDLALECLYRFLAVALSDPRGERWSEIVKPNNQRLVCDAASLLQAEASDVPIPLGMGELPQDGLDMQAVLDMLNQPLPEVCEAYDRTFGLVICRECPPYETEYHQSAEASFRSQQMADIAGFYRAFGLEEARATPERPDYLPLELEFMAFLLMKKRLTLVSDESEPEAIEKANICHDAASKFFRDHLAWWVPAFATGLRRKAGDGLYAALASVLASLIPLERRRFGLDLAPTPVTPVLIERPEGQSGCAACCG